MKAFFDTSVLVPAFLGEHIHHQSSRDCLELYTRADGCCGAHSLAELYVTLTKMPRHERFSPQEALLAVAAIRERLSIVSLTEDNYSEAITFAASLEIVGGTTYDALLAWCALKSEAATIYSWNTRHYSRFGPQVAARLTTP